MSTAKIQLFRICLFLLFLLNGFTGIIGAQPNPVYTEVIDLPVIMSKLVEIQKSDRQDKSVQAKTILLPMPDGQKMAFSAEEIELMSPEFKALHPEIKTYSVESAENPQVSGRLTISPTGLMVTLFTPEGIVEIAPVDSKNPRLHKSLRSAIQDTKFLCGFNESIMGKEFAQRSSMATFSNGSTTRTYDLAIVTTGEYGTTHGVNANAAVTAMVSALEDIYEKELAVKFNLLTPQIFTNPATDPFDDTDDDRTTMAAEAVAANWTDPAAYDIGHVLHSTGGNPDWSGGIAFFGLCDDSLLDGSLTGRTKAGAWSSVGTSQTDAVGLFAHEVGHQFYMAHSFNGTGENCTNNISLDHAYEIASGTTIMSYNGICGAGQNIPDGGTADYYFHYNSLNQAIDRMNATSCPASASSGNTPPIVNANSCGGAYTIPISTPFKLCGSGTDADNDRVYYSWEQLDEDGAGVKPTQGFIGATAASSSIAPLFRSYPPGTSPDRCFPNMNLIIANNYASDFEPLPTVARTLNFRLTGRDMKSTGGGVHSSDIAVTVSGLGPMALTTPNGGGAPVNSGSAITVSWNLNGINFLTNVAIKMSIDGGMTFPYVLAASTPAADGTENVTIPDVTPSTTMARIMVQSADNACVKFFDISDGDFTIAAPYCTVTASTICPDDEMTIPINDPMLNLGLASYYMPIVSKIFTFAGAPTAPFTTGTTAGNVGCQTTHFNQTINAPYVTQDFYTRASGSYSFTISPFAGGGCPTDFIVMNIYAGTFNPANTCTNLVWSSGTNSDPSGSPIFGDNFTATLNACTKYVLVAMSWCDPPQSANFTITYPSNSVYESNSPLTNNSISYVAVNAVYDLIVQQSSSANFTTIEAGSYKIYGATYKSGGANPPANASPAGWVGQTMNAVIATECVTFSTNYKFLTVTGSCMTTLTVGGTIAPGTYQASTQLTSNGTIPSPNAVAFRAGNNVELQFNFQANSGSILDVIIGPCL